MSPLPTPSVPPLGVRLRQAREQAGLTRTELGELADVDYAHVWRVERGERGLGMKGLRRIADVLADRTRRPIGTVLEELTRGEAES